MMDTYNFQTIRKTNDYTIQTLTAEQKKQQRFLIIQFRQIGDVLLTLPVVQAIKRELAECEVSFLVERVAAPLVQRNKAVDRVLVRDRTRGFIGDLGLVRTIRALSFDVVLDFIKIPSSGCFSLLSRAPVRIAVDHSLRRYFYSHTIEPRLSCGYAVDEKLVLLKALGFSPYTGAFRRIEIEPDQECRQRIAQFLRQSLTNDSQSFIVVAPTSKRATRCWPGQHYSQLIDHFYSHRQIQSVLVWGPGEEDVVKDIATRCVSPVRIFFPSSLLELLALIAECSLFIGNDSGPRHLAVSQNIPTITIHGATGVGAWTPPEPQHLAFSPCEKNECSTLECLETLQPEEIIDRALAHFDRFARTTPENHNRESRI